MPRFVKAAGAYRNVLRRYIKLAGIWRPVVKRYRKSAGVWVETWPLVPGPPGAVALTAAYDAGQDHVILTADWDAPVAGAPTAKYKVLYDFYFTSNGSYIGRHSFEVTAPTTLHVNNNSNTGFEWAGGQGWSVEVTIIPVSVENRDGEASTSPRRVIPILPAPPAPSAYTINVFDAVLFQAWTSHQGNRVDYIQVAITVGSSGPHYYSYAKNSVGPPAGPSTYPWDRATIGRANLTCQIRTVGQGGVSAWVTRTGVIPGPVRILNTRFYLGTMYCELFGDGTDVRLYSQESTSHGWVHVADYGNPAGTVSAPASAGWGRDGITQRRFVARPYNFALGWTGRDQGGTFVRKLPQPCFFQPTGDDGWRGTWRTDSLSPSYIFQGSTINGQNFGYIYYGLNAVRDRFHEYYNGYRPNITASYVLLRRGTFGAVAAISPSIYLHNAPSRPGAGQPAITPFRYDSNSIAREAAQWCGFPASWVSPYLIDGGWQGICLAHPNTALNPGLGDVSNEYSGFYRHFMGNSGGYNYGALQIQHDG